MKVYIAPGNVTHGELEIIRPDVMRQALARWKDCPVSVVIEQLYGARTRAQDKYYFSAIVRPIAERCGHDDKTMHAILKAMHLSHEDAECGRNGILVNDLVVGGSLTKLPTLGMSDYSERCIRWAAETVDLVIEDPDPRWRETAVANAAKSLV